MNPLLPGLTIVPPSITPRTSVGPTPSLHERPPRAEKTYTPRSSRDASRRSADGTGKRGQVTELPNPRRPLELLYPPTPVSSHYPTESPRAPRNRAMLKRRASVDVTTTLDRTMFAGSIEPKEVTLSRSRSLWSHKDGQATIGDGDLRETNPPRGPLTEKQRVMNVRRARKMQQVFGSEPPQALFQAPYPNPRLGGGRSYREEIDRRASMSTIASIATAELLSQQPFSHRMISASPVIATPTSPLSPISPVLSRSETSTPGLPVFEQPFARNPPKITPPFSHAIPEDTQASGATPGTPRYVVHKEKDFRQRRRRAAKLSRFFGVGYQDLEPHLAPKNRAAPQKLEVVMDDRGGLFWERHELRSLEMEDVIVKLRDLRAS